MFNHAEQHVIQESMISIHTRAMWLSTRRARTSLSLRRCCSCQWVKSLSTTSAFGSPTNAGATTIARFKCLCTSNEHRPKDTFAFAFAFAVVVVVVVRVVFIDLRSVRLPNAKRISSQSRIRHSRVFLHSISLLTREEQEEIARHSDFSRRTDFLCLLAFASLIGSLSFFSFSCLFTREQMIFTAEGVCVCDNQLTNSSSSPEPSQLAYAHVYVVVSNNRISVAPKQRQ